MFTNFSISKDNADKFFYELAKEYKKKTKFPLEIVVVGGGAIIIKYGFRLMSLDYDVIFNYKDDYVKQCIYNVAEKLHIPSDWINDDFIKSDSYTPKIIQYSTFYKTFSNIVTVRIVEREYLIAMKLVSGSTREYKHDKSDIVGILLEEMKNNHSVTRQEINTAIINLYGSYNVISDKMYETLNTMLSLNQVELEQLYKDTVARESKIREELTKLEKGGLVVRRHNIKGVVDEIQAKLDTESKD